MIRKNFDDILVRKTLFDFNLPLKKQLVLYNSNIYQPNADTFVKSDDLREDSTEKIIEFF